MTRPSLAKFPAQGTRREREAFTLIELLVATTVALLLLGLLVTIVSRSMAITRTANASLLAYNSASSALDLIALDLDSLAVTRQPFEYLQSIKEDVGALTGQTRLLLLSIASQDNTSAPDFGQLRAVSYRLLKQDPISGGSGPGAVYGLYRSTLDTATSFASFAGQTDLAPAFASLNASLDDFVVGNVIDFQIRFYPARDSVPANGSGASPQPVRISGNGTTISGAAYAGVLAWAEISLTVLEDRDNAMARLEAGSLTLADAKAQYGRQLIRKVAIRQAL